MVVLVGEYDKTLPTTRAPYGLLLATFLSLRWSRDVNNSTRSPQGARAGLAHPVRALCAGRREPPFGSRLTDRRFARTRNGAARRSRKPACAGRERVRAGRRDTKSLRPLLESSCRGFLGDWRRKRIPHQVLISRKGVRGRRQTPCPFVVSGFADARRRRCPRASQRPLV